MSRWEENELQKAKKTNRTGFNNSGPIPKKGSEKIEISPYKKWVINGDGTITDLINGIMWIQAPWGMLWTGNGFAGDPIKISWVDAKNLFGKGNFVGYNDNLGSLTEANFVASQIKNGYTRGTCRISYAGYDDWRLPTAAEWRTIQLNNVMDYELRKQYFSQLFPYVAIWQKFWTATGKWHASMAGMLDLKDMGMLEKCFTKLDIIGINLYRLFGKSFPDADYLAWTMCFDYSRDDGSEGTYPVLVIRTV